MRVTNLQARTALLVCLSMAGSSCQTAQKPVPLLPPASAPSLRAAAPALNASSQVSSRPQQTAASVPDQKVQNPTAPEVNLAPQPAADSIDALVVRVEEE